MDRGSRHERLGSSPVRARLKIPALTESGNGQRFLNFYPDPSELMSMSRLNRITHQMLVAILNDKFQSRSTVDNHEIESSLLRHHTVVFAETLLEYRSSDHPLRTFSAAFGNRIGREFKGQLLKQPVKKVKTLHLGQILGPNQSWAKVNPNAPIA
jgi:hypothetical protein